MTFFNTLSKCKKRAEKEGTDHFKNALDYRKSFHLNEMKILRTLLIFLLVLGYGTSVNALSIPIATNDYPPFTSSDSEHPGFMQDLISRAFAMQDIEVSYQIAPWKRCETLLEKGQVYAATPYYKTKEREARFDFSTEVITTKNVFFYHVERFKTAPRWLTLKDLRPYVVGGVLGYWYEPEFRLAGLTLHYSGSDLTNLELLINQRIDFTLISEITGRYLIEQTYPRRAHLIKNMDKPHSVLAFHLMISRHYPNYHFLNTQFSEGLNQLKKRGIYQALKKQYGIEQ